MRLSLSDRTVLQELHAVASLCAISFFLPRADYKAAFDTSAGFYKVKLR